MSRLPRVNNPISNIIVSTFFFIWSAMKVVEIVELNVQHLKNCQQEQEEN